jgi:hypothetical protein
VIYCVIPEPLAEELYEKLTKYYAEDPNVEVIVDRRKSSRRRTTPRDHGVHNSRQVRDRRRPRVTGEMPQIAVDVSGE